ncbi:hypothetical protein [Kitasatospora sp. McL0602]|uniref:hypothetical protein n=1 Tax=Kitasatospora sp. McL0602 TaxID=3439530 RepID=UPI003F8A6F42
MTDHPPEGNTVTDHVPDHLSETIASPLELVHQEESHGDRQAQELLLLSYTADLGFLERYAVGPARAAGARVTLVGDAGMVVFDPRSVRGPGRTYLTGLAALDRAFHPKLFVLAGPERATVAIGSGNATLAGWQANHELWTVLRSDADGTPALFGELARWLRALPDSAVGLVPDVAKALHRTADLLDHRVAAAPATEPEARFVSSLHQPLIEQLPDGPVDELLVSAPFHDPGATALAALVRRLRPGRLTVCHQPEHTELDGPAVAALLAELPDAELRQEPASERYRHGKLVEWSVGGRRWALTGSPNLSAAALLRRVGGGGNCEIGVIAPIDHSLAPEGTPVDPSAILHLTPPRRSADTPTDGPTPPMLLGATALPAAGGGVRVWLARAAGQDLAVECSEYAWPPERWEPLGTVPAGEATAAFARQLGGGDRVRLADTGRGAGGPVPVTDLTAVTDRPAAQTRARRAVTPTDLFADQGLLADFLRSLGEGSPAVTPAATGAGGPAGGRRVEKEVYQRFGLPMGRYALGQPAEPQEHEQEHEQAPRPDTGGGAEERPWFESFGEDEESTGLDGDSAESVDEAAAVEEPEPEPALDDAVRRAAWRKHARAHAAKLLRMEGLPPESQLLRTRMLLDMVARRVWRFDDRSWLRDLHSLTAALGETDFPAELEESAGSLAALALAVTAAEGTDEADRLSQARTAKAVEHLLAAATPERIAGYGSPELHAAFGPACEPGHVLELSERLVQDDAAADAVEQLEEEGWTARRYGPRLLSVEARGAGLGPSALRAVGQLRSTRGGAEPTAGAWAIGPDGAWALLLWRRPELVEITYPAKAKPVTWRHYRPTIATPGSLARSGSLRQQRLIAQGTLRDPYPLIAELLGELGLVTPMPPEG